MTLLSKAAVETLRGMSPNWRRQARAAVRILESNPEPDGKSRRVLPFPYSTLGFVFGDLLVLYQLDDDGQITIVNFQIGVL